METLDEQLNSKPSLSPKTLDDIKSTTPWIKFLCVLGFIYTGFMAMGAIGLLVVSATFHMPAFLSLIYAAFAALGIYVLVNLYQYANKLREFTITQDMNTLEAAFEKQKNFWRTYGIIILVLIVLVLVVLVFFGSMVMTMFSNMGNYRNGFH